MKVTLKELSGATWQLEVEANETVKELKERVELEKGHPVAAQKLIHNGRILSDDATIESCGFKEGHFIVVMISKAAAAPKPPVPSTPAAPAPAAPAPAPVPSTPASLATPAVSAAPATPAAPGRGPAAAVTDPAMENLIGQLMEMGFPRDQTERALRAAFGNPDRAVEYLMTGIPESLREVAENHTPLRATAAPQRQAPAPAPAQAPPAEPQSEPSAPAPSVPGDSPLAFLADMDEFLQLRVTAQTRPDALVPMLTELGRVNPRILQAFYEHKDDFLRLLNDKTLPDPDTILQRRTLQVTPEEKEAIDRLCSLGFDRARVIEAYFACDKNETLAANYLFDSHNFE